MPPPPIDEELREYQAMQAEVAQEAAAAEAELAPVFRETAERIQVKLREGADNMNGTQLRETIGSELERTVFKRRRILAQVIETSATKGRRGSHKTLRAVFGEQTRDSQVRATRKAMAHAGDRIAGRVTVDKVRLSTRIRAWDKKLGDELAREVQKGIRTRKGIEAIAKKIEKLDTTVESDLPQYLQQVEDLARKGNVKELKVLAKRYTDRAKRSLGELQANGTRKASAYSLRSPTTKFLRDVQKVGAEGVDNVVKAYVQEKAAWRAKVIARTESVQAMKDSYVEQSRDKPGVYAYEWRLSRAHPKADECDLYAVQNAHGLGPGRYPAGQLPKSHPLCKCYQVACIDKKHFDRPDSEQGQVPEDLRDRKSPDAVGWLKQNDAAAAKILGPTRHQLFKQGRNVLEPSGKPIAVGALLPAGSRHAAE